MGIPGCRANPGPKYIRAPRIPKTRVHPGPGYTRHSGIPATRALPGPRYKSRARPAPTHTRRCQSKCYNDGGKPHKIEALIPAPGIPGPRVYPGLTHMWGPGPQVYPGWSPCYHRDLFCVVIPSTNSARPNTIFTVSRNNSTRTSQNVARAEGPRNI